MALTPEQEWTLVACGMIAHADDVLEIGEWDEIVRLMNARITDEEQEKWLAVLTDRAMLESHFADMSPPPPIFSETLLRQAWHMALADGDGSDIEAAVHDRIGERIGVAPEQVAQWRTLWNERAAARAELVVAFAAAVANLDGRMDSAEAAQFDTLLERQPVSVSRRLQLAELLYSPPPLDAIGSRISEFDTEEREAVLYDIAPIVNASHRGEQEREAFLKLADAAAIPRDRAEALLSA
jgi:uncharacterized tellurite resistance protein B-like protein